MSDQINRTYKHFPFSVFAKAEYNRPIKRSRVIYIKKNYDPAEVRPVVVSLRDGKCYIIDGQHTAVALYELNKKDPNSLIYCDVRTGLTYEEEADLYVRLNKNSKKISIVDEIKGLIESRDVNALLFQEVIEHSGYTLFSSNGIRAVSASWSIFNGKNGHEQLEKVLTLINMTWQNKRGATDSTMLRSINCFLAVHSNEYDKNVFVKKLSKENPHELVCAAQSLARITRMSCPYALYMRILDAYNKQLRTNALSDKYNQYSK